MLKKLAKYGNSTTLVIDKAILELLNMDEATIVKLQTDGKSLIITPVPRADNDKISYGAEEALQAAHKVRIDKQLKQTTPSNAELHQLMPAMKEDFKRVFENNKAVVEKLNGLYMSKEFQAALAHLAQQYDPVTQADDYLREFNKLKIQFLPEWAHLDAEIAAVNKKYNNI
ncbi:MAG TPA: hypothetical protein VLH77_01930 [Gammaproteobacteria bacterium]|nr:hypothetical protein [Gammaproteobacteria bacterium]